MVDLFCTSFIELNKFSSKRFQGCLIQIAKPLTFQNLSYGAIHYGSGAYYKMELDQRSYFQKLRLIKEMFP